eukprot:764400-Hanusia_phi.AAC.1
MAGLVTRVALLEVFVELEYACLQRLSPARLTVDAFSREQEIHRKTIQLRDSARDQIDEVLCCWRSKKSKACSVACESKRSREC